MSQVFFAEVRDAAQKPLPPPPPRNGIAKACNKLPPLTKIKLITGDNNNNGLVAMRSAKIVKKGMGGGNLGRGGRVSPPRPGIKVMGG